MNRKIPLLNLRRNTLRTLTDGSLGSVHAGLPTGPAISDHCPSAVGPAQCTSVMNLSKGPHITTCVETGA